MKKDNKNKGEIVVLETEISGVMAAVSNMNITGPDGMKDAVQALSQLNKISDRITEEKEKVTKPLNEALKAERARWKPIESELDETIAVVRAKMSAYQTAKLKAEREEEMKIAGRVGEGKGKLKVETAVKKIEGIERAEGTVAAEAGMVKFRTDKKLKIWDETMIPREYLLPDERKILEDLKAGKQVEGCAIEEVQVPINFR